MKNIYILLLFLVGNLVIAQNSKSKDSITSIEEVYVTANKTATKKSEMPVAIHKLSKKIIEETKATSMYELVNKVPGAIMVNLGNEQHSMAIRQPMTTNSYFLYLEDGLPIRPLGIFNHNALLEINQFNLQTIEVVKGPTSSIYGPDAIGGSINLISVNPSLHPSFKIGIQADQFGYKNVSASGSTTFGKLGIHVAGLFADQKDSWMAYSDYKKANINAKLVYNFNNKTKLIGTIFNGNYNSNMFGSVNESTFLNRNYTSQTDFTYRKSGALRTKLTFEKEWNSNSKTSITTYFRDNKLGQNPSYGIRWTTGQTTAKGEINSNNFKSYGALIQQIQNINFLKTEAVAGVLYDYSPITYFSNQINLKANLNPGGQTVNTYENLGENGVKLADYDSNVKNIATYIQTKTKLNHDLILTFGMRHDIMDLSYTNYLNNTNGNQKYERTTFKGGLNFIINKNVGYYVNYSEGFTPPGVTSIFRLKPGTGGNTGIPADFYYNLKPALFRNYEIGGYANLIPNQLTIDYAFYLLNGQNELLNIRQADNSFDYQSAGQTRHKGVEFSLNYYHSKQVQFRIGGTTSQHTFVKFDVSTKPSDPLKNLDGFEMPSAPKWSGNSEITYKPNWFPNFRIALECQYVSSFYQDQINTVKYEGYTILNSRLGYTWKNFEVFTNILNATDKLYAYNVTRANTANSPATYTVAAPRTFMFGIQYSFDLKK
ncbi:MAG: TonB-dependent receptor [Flavobacteria bacterium RIFCSPLOWO2_12_FULL_31_7]|nr:MAG: TonB-dependent receptor [Flavobacteria bacterium RIFCSPLOWO2_12_FULL_31_7]